MIERKKGRGYGFPPSEFDKKLGELLRLKREDMKVDKVYVAEEILDISSIALFNYERGKTKISVENLLKLSEFYEVSYGYFVSQTLNKLAATGQATESLDNTQPKELINE